jgi:hypothetical protein
MPDLDFSRDLLEGRESSLCVMRVPPCGWSDLGTPHRVGETVRRIARERSIEHATDSSGSINLAARHAHFERSMSGGCALS